MLSVDRCREYLGPQCPLTDNEIEALRDQLYALAVVALDAAVDLPLPSASKDKLT